MKKAPIKFVVLLNIFLVVRPLIFAQDGMPVYTAGVYGNALSAHDGGLRWTVGIRNVQVVRSAAENPSQTDGQTVIYRRHQVIAYWGGKFWVMHDGPGTRISWSKKGFDWSPADSSAIFKAGHHRMGFHVASGNRSRAVATAIDTGYRRITAPDGKNFAAGRFIFERETG